MQILNHIEIINRIIRIAVEIEERNFSENEIFIGGINNNGYQLAKLLDSELEKRNVKFKVNLFQIQVHTPNPLEKDIVFKIDMNLLHKKNIIIVDDVANTGRTIFYAFDPLMKIIPNKVEIAVLIDRKHKTFPINVDYVGMSLATTLLENILVTFNENDYKANLN